MLTIEPGRIDWWATLVQLVGTVFFNLSTWDAMQSGLETSPRASSRTHQRSHRRASRSAW